MKEAQHGSVASNKKGVGYVSRHADLDKKVKMAQKMAEKMSS